MSMGDKNKEISNEEIYTLLKSVAQQNNEIKNEITLIRTQMNTLDLEISNIKQVNEKLKEENKTLKRRVEGIEKQTRENNLILYNVEELEDTQLHQQISELMRNRLDVSLDLRDISNIYRLGRRSDSKNRPIILKLTSFLKKTEILGKASGLKGTRIGISEDLTGEQRDQRKIIYDHYKAARERGYPAKLHRNGVNINGTFYKYEDLKDQDIVIQQFARVSVSTSKRKSVSAPSSPNTNSLLDSISAGANSEEAVTYLNQDKSAGSRPKNQVSQPAVETRSRANSKSSTSSLDQAVNRKTSRK